MEVFWININTCCDFIFGLSLQLRYIVFHGNILNDYNFIVYSVNSSYACYATLRFTLLKKGFNIFVSNRWLLANPYIYPQWSVHHFIIHMWVGIKRTFVATLAYLNYFRNHWDKKKQNDKTKEIYNLPFHQEKKLHIETTVLAREILIEFKEVEFCFNC